MNDIINTSAYHTDDVMAIVRKYAPNSHGAWETTKIYHMTRPLTEWQEQPRWAKVTTNYSADRLEIGLLPPDRLGDNALDRIALHNDDYAHEKVANDLAYFAKRAETYRAEKHTTTDLKIRIIKPNTSDKLISTYRNLKDKVEKSDERIAANELRVVQLRKALKELEAALPKQKEQLAKDRARLAKKEQELQTKGLLEVDDG